MIMKVSKRDGHMVIEVGNVEDQDFGGSTR
jgi:hypothetical protein